MPTKEIIEILIYLLPGFITAWVYYGLTSFPKPSQFERIVQAIIFTGLIQGIVGPIKWFFLIIGKYWIILGSWNDEKRFIVSIIIALLFGIFFSIFSNNDKAHRILRKYGITKLTSYPSEWYGAFACHQTYVVLHLNDHRRIYGWPLQWPSQPETGYFSLTDAEWLTDGGSIELKNVGSILIPASEVKFVEFMKLNENGF
jgi:hypothetical protein